MIVVPALIVGYVLWLKYWPGNAPPGAWEEDPTRSVNFDEGMEIADDLRVDCENIRNARADAWRCEGMGLDADKERLVLEEARQAFLDDAVLLSQWLSENGISADEEEPSAPAGR